MVVLKAHSLTNWSSYCIKKLMFNRNKKTFLALFVAKIVAKKNTAKKTSPTGVKNASCRNVEFSSTVGTCVQRFWGIWRHLKINGEKYKLSLGWRTCYLISCNVTLMYARGLNSRSIWTFRPKTPEMLFGRTFQLPYALDAILDVITAPTLFQMYRFLSNVGWQKKS